MKKTPKMKFVGLSLAVMVGFVVCLQSAHATVNVSWYQSATSTTYQSNIQNNDLVNQGQATFLSLSATSSAGAEQGPFTIGGINDGLGTVATSGSAAAFWNSGPVTVLFSLNTGVNTAGYDITQVQSILAWQGVNFCEQSYSLSVEKMDNTWVPITSGSDPSFVRTSSVATKSVVTDSSGVIASGVKAVQLVYALPYGDQGVVIQEIDINGVATAIPEPASCALLAVGAVFLARRRQRA